MLLLLACAGLIATWLLLCWQAGGLPRPAVLVLDTVPILVAWLALLGLTGRPVTAMIVIAAIGAGLVVADAVKRDTLREPLVFADRAELLEVVRHPGLYLPFAGPVRIAGGALGAATAAAALLWFEPPLISALPLRSALVVAALAVIALCLLLPTMPPLLPRLAALYRRLDLTRDPAIDMRRLGFLGCLIVHATLALDERPARRAAIPPFRRTPQPGGPVVLVQLESFFDARRIGAPIPNDLLPGFDALRQSAMQSGTLAVPCWGANTVRSEFEALTGIGSEALGLDRFNPYERFAQAPIRSLAWQMKQAGYRTICLHPFDKRFYARDRVMPHLGFDAFLGLERFPKHPRTGLYVTDEEVALEVARILQEEGPHVFVFAITMGNHGPWDGPARATPGLAELDAVPGSAALQNFLAGLQATDRMLPPLMAAIPPGGLLAIYGDHQPSLPTAFTALAFDDERTDYAVWRPGHPRGPDVPLALSALPDLLLQMLDPAESMPA